MDCITVFVSYAGELRKCFSLPNPIRHATFRLIVDKTKAIKFFIWDGMQNAFFSYSGNYHAALVALISL